MPLLTWNTHRIYDGHIRQALGYQMHVFESFRKQQKLSQNDLGLLLGLPETAAQSRISHYETGRRKIPTGVAHRFIELAASHGAEYTLESIYPKSTEAA